jgi:serine protease AprX
MQRHLRRTFSLGLLICLMVSSQPGNPVRASDLVWQDKVDPWILSQPTEGEIEFLVFLVDQADLSPAASLETKAEKGAFVYQTLTTLAARTQKPLRNQLNALGIPYQSFWIANMLWVRGDAGIVQSLAQRPDVAHLYANPQIQTQLPEPAPVTAMPQAAGALLWNLLQINADDAWATGYTGQGVVIGGQDTGYQWDHPALKDQYRGWNGTTASHDYNWHDTVTSGGGDCGPNSPVPCDDWGHGTHTMGTMVGDDGVSDPIGVAPGAKWIGCRNMNVGVGTPASYAECYQWFIAPTRLDGSDPRPDLAPDVINNSWSCPPSEGCNAESLRAVIEAVHAAGIVTVHSAGNYGPGCSTVNTPGAIYPESFSVGSVDNSDHIANSSSRGPVTVDGSNTRKPNVSAPGVDIYSSWRGSTYKNSSGTSMAAPHVAGLVGLLISANPGLAGQVDQIETMIEHTALPLYTTNGCGGDLSNSHPNHTYGWGRIDAWNHYLALENSVFPSLVSAGSVLTYTLTISHIHLFTSTNQVILTDTIPEGTQFITATLPYSQNGETIQWTFDTLGKTESRSVELVVQIPMSATMGTISNKDYGVRSDEVSTVKGEPVDVPLNYRPGVELTPNLSSTVMAGQVVSYPHTLMNTGNYTDTFLLSLDSSQGWARITTTLITLGAGNHHIVEVVVTTPEDVIEGLPEISILTATSQTDPSVFASVTDKTRIYYRYWFPMMFGSR